MLKIGDNADPVTYRTVAGLRADKISLSEGKAIIRAAGIFLGNEAERQVQSLALSGETHNVELSFEQGDKWRGKFKIAAVDFGGRFNGENNYIVNLEGIEVTHA